MMIELSVRTENKDVGARHRRRYITRNIKSDANPVDPPCARTGAFCYT